MRLTPGEEHQETIDLVIYEEVDSTNDELRRILAQEDQRETTQNPNNAIQDQQLTHAVMAQRQTKGKGRLGRDWVSPPGGLYLSVALDTTSTSQRESALSLIVALALCRKLEYLVTCADTQNHTGLKATEAHKKPDFLIKWPNDLICQEGKLAGILVESFSLPSSRRKKAIVGVGINMERPSRGASEKAAYLSDFGYQVSHLEDLARAMTESILEHYATWSETEYRFAPFYEEYLARLSLRGQWVTVRTGEGTLIAEGVAEGITECGQLIVKYENDQTVAISAGEVTLREENF